MSRQFNWSGVKSTMGAFTTKLTLRKKLTNCPQTLGLGQSHLISWVFQANLSLLTVKRSIFKCITLGHSSSQNIRSKIIVIQLSKGTMGNWGLRTWSLIEQICCCVFCDFLRFITSIYALEDYARMLAPTVHQCRETCHSTPFGVH